jgi:uncharacterized protein
MAILISYNGRAMFGGAAMRLDLHEIIGKPGGCVPFEYSLDLSDVAFQSVTAFLTPLKVSGEVRNSAGVLTLSANVEADMKCVCDRCAAEFNLHKSMPVEAVLTAEMEDRDNPDMFLLDGNFADIDEIINTFFVFDMESQILCKPDCKGLCHICGKNLNEGSCGCGREPDPRLAALRQLLDNGE